MSMLTTPKVPKGFDLIKFPTRSGQSEEIYSKLYQLFPEFLERARGSPEMFQQMEAPALRQFQQQIAPGIAQRYAGSGIGASSGMQNSLAGAGRELEEDLASKRQQYMQQSMQNVLGLGDYLLQNPSEQYYFQKKKPSWWQQLLGLGSPLAGAGLGAFGGGLGSMIGLQAGSGLGQGFFGLR